MISEKKKEKYFCMAAERGICLKALNLKALDLKALEKIVFGRKQIRPFQGSFARRHAGPIEQLHYLPICPPGGPESVAMSDGIIGRGRAVGGGTTARRGKRAQTPGRKPGSGLLLCACLVISGMTPAFAEPTAPAAAVDHDKQPVGRDGAPLSPPKRPEPATAVREPEPKTSGLGTAAPSPGEIGSKPELAGPSLTAPKPEPTVQKPEAAPSRGAAKDVAVPQLVLSADVARKIGQKVWLNETGGKVDAITSWNANEEFASLGVGHFIWFPLGKWLPFEESFPGLLEFMRQRHVRLPAWLDKPQIPANPWTSKADFKKNFNSPEMKELRQFLLATVAEQTQFLVARAQGAMDKILKKTPDSTERAHIITQFARIARASQDLYPLIDYINFKGEGINPNEAAPDKATGQRQGWGFKQVLLKMNGSTDDPKAVLAEYADAAQAVLQQRVRNLPSNRVFEVGWLRRVDTYRRPIADAEPGPKREQNVVLRMRTAR
jgi:hypothetical protein